MPRKITGRSGMIETQAREPRLTCGYIVERVTRIELALSAWEADVLPLNYTRADYTVDLTV
jgi:hypothetical protein